MGLSTTARWSRETPGDPLLHLPTGEGWNLQFPIRTNTNSNLAHLNSFFHILLQRHFLQVLNRTEQKSRLIHWAFRNAWQAVSAANKIRTLELWQIENLLKTVQQSMQPVSILVLKKINFLWNFCKFCSKEVLSWNCLQLTININKNCNGIFVKTECAVQT